MAAAADPGLDAEPAAGDERAQDRRHVGADDAERGAAIDGEGNAVARPGVGVEDHRHQHDDIAEENGEDGLPPVHAAVDERRGQHVGRDAGGHGNPQGRDVPHAPPHWDRGWCHVAVVIRRGGDVGRQLDDFAVGCLGQFCGCHRQFLVMWKLSFL